jgi:hypothetical protein
MSAAPWVLGGIAALILIPAGCGAYSVWTSATTAPARVINKTLETNNILTNYEMFHDEAQNFGARVNQIGEHRGFLKSEADPAERTRLRMEMAAQQQSCRELAADYNANSRKLNRKLFKDAGLPAELDATQCETP